jgi:hypothetical protein
LVYNTANRQEQPYSIIPNDQGITSPPPAEIKSNIINVTATLGFKF